MAIKPSHILGMNSRFQYTKLNPASAKKFGFSKLVTKELLTKHNISTAAVYRTFSRHEEVDDFNWESIPVPFVVKPASGSAGKGIVVIIKKVKTEPLWISADHEEYSPEDLNLHLSNILDGEFSTWGSEHKALIEEMIVSHPTLAKLSEGGTPDIRIIVYNSIPIMAMARIPTKESQGRANLDKGAIGLGIDIATGITTYGIVGKGDPIKYFPNTKKKVNGIKIPFWKSALTIATHTAQVAGYHFMGADIFIHPDKGPMIVELNGFPGLSIQLANRAGMKRRIERVEGLDVRDTEHGVKIAQALFAETFSDKVKIEEGLQIIPVVTSIKIYGDEYEGYDVVETLINTGRVRSAISEQSAEKLGLLDYDDLLWQQVETLEGKVPVVEVKCTLKNLTFTTAMVVTKRLNRTKYKVELGRKDLHGFLVGDESDFRL